MSYPRIAKSKRGVRIASATLACCLISFAGQVRAIELALDKDVLSTRKIVIEEIEKLIAKHNLKVGVMGSSVKGKKYFDPLKKSMTRISDVDLTLIIEGVDDEAELFKRWTDFYGDLRGNIQGRLKTLSSSQALQSHFGADLADDYMQRVLDSVNVYPPDQLVAGFATEADYKQHIDDLFHKYGKTSKHLLNLGSDPFDAIVGSDAKAYRQFYEKTHGVVFEMNGGKMIRGFHDLQEVAKFSSSGTAGLSKQFLGKCSKAIENGNSKDLYKNLERLNQFLKKSKQMAGVPAAARANPEIDDLLRKYRTILGDADDAASMTKAYQKWASDNLDDINRALAKADIETRLCQSICDETEAAVEALLRKTFSGGKWQAFKNTLARYYRDVSDAIPPGAIMKAMQALSYGDAYLKVRETYATEGIGPAMNLAVMEALGIVNMPFGLGRMIFDLAMNEIKHIGYNISTSRQGCEDFLAGIIAVTGAEKIQKGYQMEELARLYIHMDKVSTAIDHLAGEAVKGPSQNPSAAELEVEAGKKANLMEKCGKPLLTQWWKTRRGWFNEAATSAMVLRRILDQPTANLRLELVSQVENKDTGGRDLTFAIGTNMDREGMYAELLAIRETIRKLGGRERVGELVVEEDYMWMLDGKRLPNPEGRSTPRRMVTLEGYDLDTFMGHRGERTITIPDDKPHQLELVYRLVFQPKLSIAPQVMNQKRLLTGTSVKKAIFPIESPPAEISITAPTDVIKGDPVGLAANFDPSKVEPQNLKWSVNKEDAGAGGTISLTPNEPGKLTIVLEHVNKDGITLNRSDHTLTVFDPATVTFRVFDEETKAPIEMGWVELNPVLGDGQNYDIEIRNGIATVNLVAGPYFYSISGDGYDSLLGNTFFTFGDTDEFYLPKASGPMEEPPSTEPEPELDPSAQYLGLSLDHRELILEPGRQGYIRAKAFQAKLPAFVDVDVTNEVTWESSDPAIVSVKQGVVEANVNAVGEAIVTATFSSQGQSKPLQASCRVLVRDLSTPLPQVDFTIRPLQKFYPPGTRVRFVQNVPPPHDDLRFTWYFDGEMRDGPEVEHVFTDIDKYTVRLVVTSKSSGLEDSFVKTIEVSEMPDASLTIRPSAEPPYPDPSTVTFFAIGENLPANPSYTWMVDGAIVEFDGIDQLQTTLVEGQHQVTVYARGEGKELSASHRLTIGEMPATNPGGPTAKWVNRFSLGPVNAKGEVDLMSSYWIGGDGKWSTPIFNRTLQVEGTPALETGEQDNGLNTGWLFYIPKDTDQLRFEVLGFDFGRKQSNLVYSGLVPLHNRKVDRSSLRFLQVKSRAADFQWSSTLGDIGKVRVYKIPEGEFTVGGLHELDFIESGRKGPSNTDKRISGDFIKMTPKISSSRTDFDRPVIRIEKSSKPVEVAIIAKGSGDFGYVDAKGHYHHTPGRKINYRDHTVTLGPGIHKGPIIPQKELDEAIGSNVRYLLIYCFFLEEKQSVYAENGVDVVTVDDAFTHYFGPTGISKDSTRKGWESFPLDTKPAANQGPIELTWNHLSFAVRLVDGKLDARGAGHPPWEDTWIRVAESALAFNGAASGQGPVIAYQTAETQWKVILLHFRTGRPIRSFTSIKPIKVERGGEFGAYLRIGDEHFTIDVNNTTLRKIDPNTKQFIP